MMIKKRKWFSLMIYLILASVLAISLSFILLQACVELFFLFFYNTPFKISNIDLLKCLKAGLFCGVLAGSGCWWIYYQHYQKNSNR